MKHILVAKRIGTSNFTRSAFHAGQVIQDDHMGRALHAHFPALREDMESCNGNMSLTISSFRGQDEFIDPDNANVPERAITILFVPLVDLTGRADMDALRLWTSVLWSSPHAPPVKGDRIRQRMIWPWIENFFNSDTLEAWKSPSQTSRTEIWLRPEWNAERMFPLLFPPRKPKVEESEEEVEEVEEVSTPNGELHDVKEPEPVRKNLGRVNFTPRTRWRFFDKHGKEIARNFTTKEAAELALQQYNSVLEESPA